MDYYQPVAAAPPGAGSPFVSYEQAGDHPSFEEWRQQQEAPPAAQPASASAAATGLEDAMWGLSLQSAADHQGMGDGGGGGGGGGPYPERPGEQDCVYYMRTGLCAFGMSCKFNHPPNRKLAAAIARGKGEYPERPGQPECQYFLKTGTCKFGSTCKYDHPRDKAGIQSRVQLNIVGLPYRPGEKECAYYMRTGSCKYGVTCKFHHPQPAVVPTSAIYAAAAAAAAAAGGGSQPGTPGGGGAATGTAAAPQYQPGWPPSIRPFPSPRLQAGASSYTPLLLPSPQGVVSIPWGTYHDQQLYLHGASSPTADYSPFVPGSPTMGLPAALQQHQQQREQHGKDAFPERPGVADCQYYLKTGDCKYGASCRFHHPRERMSAPAPTMLSPMGLPLRTGVQPCSYYVRFGICKFGPTCKFDHPIAALYGFGPPSPAEIPASPPSIHHVGRATLVEIDEAAAHHHHHHIAGSSSSGSLSSTSTSAGGGSAASSSAAAGVSDSSATLSSTSASSAPPPSSSSSSSAAAAQRKGSAAEEIAVTSAGNSSGSQAEI